MKLTATAIGRLGRDPKMQYTQAGKPMTTFSIATNPYWGDRKDITVWIDCVAFDKLAEIVKEYLNKGSLVFIEGTPSARAWMPRDTNDTEPRASLNIVVRELKMLGNRSNDGDYRPPEPHQEEREPRHSGDVDVGDTLNLDADEDFF